MLTRPLPALICVILLALPSVAQAPKKKAVDKRDEFANTAPRRAVLAKAMAQIQGDPQWDYFTTPNLIVLWEFNKNLGRPYCLERAKQAAAQIERWIDACATFLPPDAERGDIFRVASMTAEPIEIIEDDGTKSRAGQWHESKYEIWRMYVKSWFGHESPEAMVMTSIGERAVWDVWGEWYQALALACIEAHDGIWLWRNAKSEVMGDRWPSRMSQIRAVPRKSFDGLLSRLDTLFPPPAWVVEGDHPPPGTVIESSPQERQEHQAHAMLVFAWATFLMQGEKQLGAKFKPEWKTWLVDYVRATKAGTEPAKARADALRSLNAKEFEDALAKWSATAK